MYENLKEFLTDDFWIMPATPKYIDNGIPYITSKNIKNGKIDYSNINYISKEDYENISKNRPIKVNDILISMIGTIGETAVVLESDGEFYGQNMFLVRLNENKINQRFFLNYFKSSFVKNQLFSKQNKSTQSYLKANHIEDLKVPVISIQEQIKISEKLDKIQIMIDEKKEQINLLNQLIKSQFVEMFENEKNVMTLDKICKKITDGSHNPPKGLDYETEYLMLSSQNIIDGKINFDNPRFLTKEDFDSEYKRTNIENGDILLTIVGTVGRTAIVNEEKVTLQRSVAILKLNEEVNPYYVSYSFQDEFIKTQLIKGAKGVAQKGIYLGDLKKIKIKVPPIELQDKFAQIVEQIDKQKFEFENSLRKLEELQTSLMQEYFG